jgi:ArsR family transcriptional regulator, arsenate/arsenite/antimonite-responsive transcriptional repressor
MSNQSGLQLLVPDQRPCCSPLTRAPLDAGEAARLTQVFKALADPVRLRLLSLIGAHDGGEACVCDLTGAFDLTAPTISHHLKVLREAGLISSDRRGTWVYYRLVPAALADLAGLFTPALEPASALQAASAY